MSESEVADLIDAAAGLPDLEARVAELTQELSHIKRYMDLCDVEQFNLVQHAFRSRDKALKRESKLMAERDAAKTRVAELERELRRVEVSHDEVNKMYDAALRKLEAVIELHIPCDPPDSLFCVACGTCYPCPTLRLARGGK